MRRSRLVRLIGSAALVGALLVPSAAMASGAPAGGALLATGIAQAVTTPQSIDLGCTLVSVNPLGPASRHPAVACHWTAPSGVEIRAYRLWRIVDAHPRRLEARIAATAALRHLDRDVRVGHVYTYRVVGIGADGSRVAVSDRVTVRVARPFEALRLRCALAIDGAQDGVACRWSAATRPAAVRYVLVRSVDGAARERIYRTALDGRRTFLDTDVKAGERIRYAVLALTASGRVVSIGGPVLVTLPDPIPAAR